VLLLRPPTTRRRHGRLQGLAPHALIFRAESSRSVPTKRPGVPAATSYSHERSRSLGIDPGSVTIERVARYFHAGRPAARRR